MAIVQIFDVLMYSDTLTDIVIYENMYAGGGGLFVVIRSKRNDPVICLRH